MESLSLKKENLIEDIRNLFRLKKELNYTGIKDTINLLRLEKETKAIKGRILRDIKNIFEHEKEEETCNKLVRVGNFWSSNYNEYESYGDKNETPSVEEYLHKKSQKIWQVKTFRNFYIYMKKIL